MTFDENRDPAAGLGTRFLPLTREQPKELLPVVDRPAIHWVVEEAIASGADDLLIVTGREKRAIEGYFDGSLHWEHHLKRDSNTHARALAHELRARGREARDQEPR